MPRKQRKPITLDNLGGLLESGEVEGAVEQAIAEGMLDEKERAKAEKNLLAIDAKKIVIPQPKFERRKVAVIGDNTLVVQRWSQKAKQEMRDKQQGRIRPKKEPKNPEADFIGSLYAMSDGRHGVPAAALKKAMVRACSLCEGITMVAARMILRVEGERTMYREEVMPGRFSEQSMELLPIHGIGPFIREDPVRIGKGMSRTADLRYRGSWDVWALEVPIRWMGNILTEEQAINLLQLAGFCVGIGEDRPEKQGGSWGTFHVATEEEYQEIQRIIAKAPKISTDNGGGGGKQASGRKRAAHGRAGRHKAA